MAGQSITSASDKIDYWKSRSRNYNARAISRSKVIIDAIVNLGGFTGKEKVLDLGTGTGVVANKIAHVVKAVVAVDTSPDMLKMGDWQNNVVPIIGDIRNHFLLENTFDNVVASYVLQHTKGYTSTILEECYRILKQGGSIILVVPVPPHDGLKEEVSHIFSYKDDRTTFLPSEVLKLLKFVQFTDIESEIVYVTIDLVDWLDNSFLSTKAYKEMLNLHLHASELFKKAYNMRIVKERYLLDTKVLVVRGRKKFGPHKKI